MRRVKAPTRQQQQKQQRSGAVGRPMSTSEQLQFLQTWGQGCSSEFALNQPESLKTEAASMATSQRPHLASMKVTTPAFVPTGAGQATLSGRKALARGCKALRGCAGAKRFVPMSAWVNNTGEDYDGRQTQEADGAKMHVEDSLPSSEWTESYVRRSEEEASTVERVFSIDVRSMSSNSSTSTLVLARPLDSSPVLTPMPSPTLSSPQSASWISPPPSPALPSPPPPLPPLRTASVGNRRVLHQPSDVAALMHELLWSSSGLAAKRAAVAEAIAAPATTPAPPPCKPVRGLAAGRADRVEKSSDTTAATAAPQAGRSQSSGVLNALVKIIAERINSGDHRTGRLKDGNRKATLLEHLELNRALLATGEGNCGGNGTSDGQKSRKHTKLANTKNCFSRQQNCNNCYEKPPNRCRHTCHHSHLRSLVCSRASHKSGSRSHRKGECTNSKAAVGSSQRASDQQQPRPPALSNGSNAGYRISNELFFECADPGKATWKSLRRRNGTPPDASPAAGRRRRLHRSLDCRDAATDERTENSTKSRRFERVNTDTGTCSTEDATGARANVFISNALIACHPQFNLADWRVTTDGASLVSCCSRSAETADDSPIVADRPRWRRPVTNKDHQQHQKHQHQHPQPKQPRETALALAAAANAAAYTEQLFGSVLMSRDESGFVQAMNDVPSQLKLRSLRLDVDPGVCESKKLAVHQRSSVKIPVPKYMLRVKGERNLDYTQSGQGSSDTHCVTIGDFRSTRKCESSQTPSVPFNATPDQRAQSAELLLVHPPVQQTADLRPAANLLRIGCGTADGAAKTASRKSRGGIGCSHQMIRRRSRIHVVEPLADAVQQLIELPVGIIERLFSSWRPMKYTRLLMYSVLIFSIESTLETSNQPVSIFCHSCGSVITTDCKVTMIMPNGHHCCGIESVIFHFARSVISRIIECLGMKCIFLDSPIEVAELLNQSLLRTSMTTIHIGCGRDYGHLQFPNRIFELGEAWPSGSHTEPNRSAQAAYASCQRRSGRVSDQDFELLRVTSNLAVRFRRAKRQGDHHRRCRHHGRRLGMSSRICCHSFSDNRDSVYLDPNATMCQQRLQPESLTYSPCTASAEFDSVPEDFVQLEAGYFARMIVTHCPELVTYPNLAVVSLKSEADDSDSVDFNGEMSAFTMDTATSDYRSNESHETAMRDLSDPVTVLKERMAEVTDELVFDSDEPHPLAADGRFLDALLMERVTAIERQHQQECDAVDNDWGECWRHEDAGNLWCVGQDASSRDSDLTQRRSYNSHSFLSRTAAVIPGTKSDDDGVLLSITCEFTVVERAQHSGSLDESHSSDSSELVCA